ncbi:cache domain-containing sensor histidine kinase [Cohnella silvisoli]|uniref:histidine kinase n=1 Tax=Cohnella silvisoli TaxID=2873699 RepID=A0ABV1KZH4_9BACL|nr:sensor histidine kinase [Cohnella silvisoli]MCD9024762.1 sensor histidine kinase [Cohnella silvisoli]
MKFAWGLKNRLLVALLLLSLIPIVIVVVVTNRNYAALVESQVKEVSLNLLDRSSIRMTNRLEEIGRVSAYLAYRQTADSDTILSFLGQHAGGKDILPYDRLRHTREFKTATESLLLNHDYIEGLYVFAEDGTVFANTKGSELKTDYRPLSSAWYRDTIGAKGKMVVGELENQDFLLSGNPSIAFSRALYEPATNRRIGVLLINCSLSLFDELKEGMLAEQRIFLLNGIGNRLYGEGEFDEEWASSAFGAGSRIDDRSNTLILHNTFSEYDWHMVIAVSLDAVTGEARSTSRFALWFGICWAILAIGLSLWIAKAFSQPVNLMAQMMKRYQTGQLPPRLERYERRTDEIGILYNRYFTMLHEIDTLIRERYHNQFIAMSSKMKALEAQINSHFLFNTLATMNSIAVLEEVHSLSAMSKALGDMFRYSIKINRDLVMLKEELGHVHNYMTIQSFRYGDKIRLETEIPPKLETFPVLKLILQPIVENAVYHGIEKKKGHGTVRIRAWEQDGGISIEVQDDGVGIPPDRLMEVRSMLGRPAELEELHPGKNDARSIGLYNVHARIALYYGNAYGIEVDSADNRGTTVRIRLPATMPSEGDSLAKRTNSTANF